MSTFAPARDGRTATGQLRTIGITDSRVNLLVPGESERALTALPTDEGEAPGIGTVVGGVVGGAVGMATMPIGAVVASALVPGIGPIIAIGAIATAVLGLTGAKVREAMETALTQGVPRDDVFFIEEALRQGHTVVIVLATDDAEADDARAALSRAGAESLDTACGRRWLQLRGMEETAYAGEGGSFRRDESLYRLGFECALAPDVRGQTGDSLEAALRARHPDGCTERAFRAGFERGRAYDRRREEAERVPRSA